VFVAQTGWNGAQAAPKTCSQIGAERYIKDSEAAWAESVATANPSAVRRILADDFVWVYPDGTLKNKQEALAVTASNPWRLRSDHLEDVRVRLFGNTAIAQGNESWVRQTEDGTNVRNRFVWTDTWVCRGGSWEVVAAEYLVAPAAK
jgi:ketosteroid isomerase-like protein